MFAAPQPKPAPAPSRPASANVGAPLKPRPVTALARDFSVLRIAAADDPLEREADRLADQVLRATADNRRASLSPPHLARQCAACAEQDEETLLHRQASAAAPLGPAPSSVHAVLHAPGQPLDSGVRSLFEPRFGHDFSQVVVHTGAAAEHSARQVGALAYTVGHHIVFGAGRYAPKSTAGQRLLAHELAHVVQQSGGGVALQREVEKRICVPGLAADDLACAGVRAAATAPGVMLSAAALGAPPAGLGLRVPVHPQAVSGIHEWNSDDAVPEGRANNHNRFTVGGFRLQQICAIDAEGTARVMVYFATGGATPLAVGPNSLQLFVLTHGGTLTARAGNADGLDQPRGLATGTLPAAPDAFSEEPQIYYLAPRLPGYDVVEPPPQPFRIGIYLMQPYLRRLPGGKFAVLYYVASRQMTKFGARFRTEYVVGPEWLGYFRSRADYYAGIAELAFLTPGGESAPPDYVVRSARYIMGVLHNDPERAREGLRAWKAAAEDPGWWLQVAAGYAGAAQPAPRVTTPTLEVVPSPTGVPGGGGLAPPVRPVAPVRVGGGASGGGATATAQALAPEPLVVPQPAPNPAAVPRTRPQGVPGWNRVPAPVARRVPPPSPAASGAAQAAAQALSPKAAVPAPPAAPGALPAIGTAPNQRRQATQTCINAELDILQAEKDQICNNIPGESCSPAKVSPKRLARQPCSRIRARIAAIQDCLNIREVIQRDCFGGVPDAVHARVMGELAGGLAACLALEAVNCAPGHPMAKL